MGSRGLASCQNEFRVYFTVLPWLGLDALRSAPPSITDTTAKKRLKTFASDWEFDWSRIWSPFLGANGVKPTTKGAIERMVYFRWVWEPGDSGNVSTATKADEAEVNLSLWNVGGDGPGMEAACATIRKLAPLILALIYNEGSCSLALYPWWLSRP
jgi:hypothetical protein